MKELPEGWRWVKLIDVAEIIMGQSPPGDTYNNISQGMPFLQGKAEFGPISPKHIKFTTKPLKKASKGSILISVRAPVGDVNIADIDYCIGRGLATISLNKGENLYLFYFLRCIKNKLKEEGAGSTFKAINKSILENLKIPIPFKNGKPDLEKQQKIVSILEKAEQTKRL
ncbi:MAG: restriction endonuclease subunit S, partial [Halobacteriota archaeon]|nr:restriction endonuclease subunit S [Halobacteriota archaeon]